MTPRIQIPNPLAPQASPSRRPRRPRRHGSLQAQPLRALLLMSLALVGLSLGGCGSKETYPPYNGIILVDNVSQTTTNEIIYTFFVAPFGQPWTGDILGGDLLPNSSRSLGVWNEDFYDAEGDMELGDVIQWFDIFVGEGATTVFEVL